MSGRWGVPSGALASAQGSCGCGAGCGGGDLGGAAARASADGLRGAAHGRLVCGVAGSSSGWGRGYRRRVAPINAPPAVGARLQAGARGQETSPGVWGCKNAHKMRRPHT